MIRWFINTLSETRAVTVGDISSTVIEVTFSRVVISPGDDYSLGVSVTINGIPAVVVGAARQPDLVTVRFGIDTEVMPGSVVTWAYSRMVGDLESVSGRQLKSITPQIVTNTVGGHLYFNTAANSGHLATIGV
jgi:hypothetical protein